MNIVLLEPEIPMNTGNIGRSCVLTGSTLHLIRPLGFLLTDKEIRRSGLDYWPHLDLCVYDDRADFERQNPNARCFYASTHAKQLYSDVRYRPDDYIFFGKESKGLPKDLLEQHADRAIRIPMDTTHARSLNLSVSAAVVLYEALRQQGFEGLR